MTFNGLVVGGDINTWGGLLLTGLSVAHNDDGTPNSLSGLMPTSAKTSNYTASIGDFVPVDASGGNITITLPTSPTDRSRVAIKIIAISGTNTATIVAGGSDVFNKSGGSASITLSTLNYIAVLQYSSSSAIWYVHDGLSLSSLDNRYSQQGSMCINVKDAAYGAKGDGSTDDTSAIQAAFNAAISGSCVLFPAGIYMVSGTLLYPGNIAIVGSGASDGGAIIKVVTGTALTTPILCDKGWYNNAATCDNPVEIRDLKIDGNSATSGSGAHGLVGMNFWSKFENIFVNNVAGDGIHFSPQTQNSSHISNTCVEAKFVRCQIRTTGGYGIRVQDSGSPQYSSTDGFIESCIIATTSLDGIRVDSSQGWLVYGCHLYGCVLNGIHMARADSCRILCNYIEPWGSNTGSNPHAAICLGDGVNTFIGASNPSIVIGNTMFFTSGGGTGTVGIIASTSSGVFSNLIICNNGLHGNGFYTAIKLQNQGSTSTTTAVVSGNEIASYGTFYSFVANGGGMNITGDVFQTSLATTATQGFARIPACAGTPTGTPLDLTKGIPLIFDTSGQHLWVYTSGAWVQV